MVWYLSVYHDLSADFPLSRLATFRNSLAMVGEGLKIVCAIAWTAAYDVLYEILDK